jgi:hypothetical protein
MEGFVLDTGLGIYATAILDHANQKTMEPATTEPQPSAKRSAPDGPPVPLKKEPDVSLRIFAYIRALVKNESLRDVIQVDGDTAWFTRYNTLLNRTCRQTTGHACFSEIWKHVKKVRYVRCEETEDHYILHGMKHILAYQHDPPKICQTKRPRTTPQPQPQPPPPQPPDPPQPPVKQPRPTIDPRLGFVRRFEIRGAISTELANQLYSKILKQTLSGSGGLLDLRPFNEIHDMEMRGCVSEQEANVLYRSLLEELLTCL